MQTTLVAGALASALALAGGARERPYPYVPRVTSLWRPLGSGTSTMAMWGLQYSPS
jgi:hypothetical protein